MPPGGVVHLRLNDPDTSRNPHINFITALDLPDKDQALRRLQQLAAMVKPVMQARSLQINSLEEFEHNREFAGRCWNYGENVELVLRDQRGSFLPLRVVLMVFCHELAHIKHMNHIPRLHGKLNAELRDHCKELQAKGYYGDGMWSAGQRLADSGWVGGDGMMQPGQMLPQDICGGAFRRKGGKGKGKASSSKRRRVTAGPGSRSFKGPSLHTGAQTARNITGSTSKRRVLKSFGGGGSRVDGANEMPTASAKSDEYKKDPNSSFRKRTQAPSAREARAMAALARMEREKRDKEMEKLQEEERKARGSEQLDTLDWDQPRYAREEHESEGDGSQTEDEEEDEGGVYISGDEGEREAGPSNGATGKRKAEDGDVSLASQLPSTMASRETAEQRARRTRRAKAADAEAIKTEGGSDDSWGELLRQSGFSARAAQTAIATAGPSREQGSRVAAPANPSTGIKDESQTEDEDDGIVIVGEKRADVKVCAKPGQEVQRKTNGAATTSSAPMKLTWSCLVCTLENEPGAERCAVCETTRGESTMGA